MSTKIEYEDGSVYFEPEPSETEDLEYVYLLCDDYENGGYYPYRFFNRMCNGLIKAPFSKLQFICFAMIMRTAALIRTVISIVSATD